MTGQISFLPELDMASKTHKIERIVTKEHPSIDDFGSVEELNEMRMESVKKELVDGGWEICPICNEAFVGLCSKGICGPCFEKNLKKSEEIAQKFKAEGYKEIPENERENAMYCLNGWINERDMPEMEPRKGTRYFLIDVMRLTWRFFFRMEE